MRRSVRLKGVRGKGEGGEDREMTGQGLVVCGEDLSFCCV